MSGIAVVTDSSAALPQEMVQAYGIHVVPLYVSFGQESLRDGVDLSLPEFYRRLRTASTLPTTSQPAVGDFLSLYRRLSKNADAIVSIHISKELSGTVDSAQTARQMLLAEAEKAGAPAVPIHIIDSRTVSMGLGFTVLEAARAVVAGKSAPEVVQVAEALMPRIDVVFTVETLEYLRKGGRIGGAAALLGVVMDIKPILSIQNGRIAALGKVHAKKQARARLLEIATQRLGPATSAHVAVVHADAPEEANRFADDVYARVSGAERLVLDIGAAIGSHTGPGTLGLVFYRDA